MPRVTSLDGKEYELDEATLKQCLLSEEELKKWGSLPSLPPPPAPVTPASAASPVAVRGLSPDMVRVRRGPGNSTIIELKLPGA